jgi:hypothetical protein
MPPLPDPLPHVRKIVRSLLLSSPAYAELEPAKRNELAESMVKVCHAAAMLVREEVESDAATRAPRQPARAPVLAAAQSAGDSFSGVAAERVAATTQQILNAVSFPRFVTDLINGVFKAMIDSSIQQMNAYVELLNNVASSTEGFADSQMSEDRARQWLVEHYGSLQLVPSDDGDEGGGLVLELREGASMPSPAALRTDLGLGPEESVPAGDPEALVPFARRHLAKSRQGMLATMVMLGMQRIVVESGRINASMRFHIDTRSMAQDDRGSRFDLTNQINAAGSYGLGAWGVSASMSNTIGYVSTQRMQTTEEMNTDLDLNSSVEVIFKSDYLPLNRLATNDQVSRIRENSRNPEAETQTGQQARDARIAAQIANETARRTSLDLTRGSVAPPAPGAPGTTEDARRARREGGSSSETGVHSGSGTSTPAGGGGATTPAAGSGATTPAAGSGTTPAAGSGTTTGGGGGGDTARAGGGGRTPGGSGSSARSGAPAAPARGATPPAQT